MLAIKYLLGPTRPFLFLSPSNKRYLLLYVESHFKFADSTYRNRGFVLSIMGQRLHLIKRLLILAEDKIFMDSLLSKIYSKMNSKYPSKNLGRETLLFVIFYTRLRLYLYYAFRKHVIRHFLLYFSKNNRY